MNKKFAAVVVLIIAGIALIGFVFMKQKAVAPLPAPAEETAIMAPAEEPIVHPVIRDEALPAAEAGAAPEAATIDGGAAGQPIAAPPMLADSDETVRQAAEDLSAPLPDWLLPEEQIRKWVMAVNLLAEGKIPVKDRPLEFPLAAFRARKTGDTFWLDRAGFSRSSQLIEAVTRIPPAQLARYYRSWYPLLQQAQDELGSGERFHDRLQLAIGRVLAVVPLQGDVELKQSIISYQYADQSLEKASAVEKLMWRMGPENARQIQDYLRELQPLLVVAAPPRR